MFIRFLISCLRHSSSPCSEESSIGWRGPAAAAWHLPSLALASAKDATDVPQERLGPAWGNVWERDACYAIDSGFKGLPIKFVRSTHLAKLRRGEIPAAHDDSSRVFQKTRHNLEIVLGRTPAVGEQKHRKTNHIRDPTVRMKLWWVFQKTRHHFDYMEAINHLSLISFTILTLIDIFFTIWIIKGFPRNPSQSQG